MSRAGDLSPVTWVLGQAGERPVALGGWIQEMDDGGDAAHLVLHPVGDGVADRMRRLGDTLGLDATGLMPTIAAAVTSVELDGGDVWVVHEDRRLIHRSVTPDWAAAARARGVVALWLGWDGTTILNVADADRYVPAQQRRGRLHAGLLPVLGDQRWAWLHLWLDADQPLIHAEVGPADQDRTSAHAAVQAVLDGDPVLGGAARAWVRGAREDTVVAGEHVWTLVAHDGDPRSAAQARVDEHVAVLRAGTGIDVTAEAIT